MANIDIILVADKEIRALNKRWFGKRNSTDVIAFDYGKKSVPQGEVYISLDTAKRQAKARGVKWKHELLRLAIHGTAHVAGYDDLELKEFCKMREKEWEMLIAAL